MISARRDLQLLVSIFLCSLIPVFLFLLPSLTLAVAAAAALIGRRDSLFCSTRPAPYTLCVGGVYFLNSRTNWHLVPKIAHTHTVRFSWISTVDSFLYCGFRALGCRILVRRCYNLHIACTGKEVLRI